MIMLILPLHILVSLILSTAMVGVMVSAYKQHETRLYRMMMVSFGAVAGSGILLLLAAPSGLGRFCAVMSAFTLLTFAVRGYYRRQMSTQTI